MQFEGLSDKGSVRDTNEDSFLIDKPLFAVADGMGGHMAGEIASKIAVDTLASFKQEIEKSKNVAATLKSAFDEANTKILKKSEEDLDHHGLGTTLSCVFIKNGTAHVGHIGDSRVYLIRDGSIKQATRDHSFVAEMVKAGQITKEEAEVHPQRNVITKALGVKEASDGDFFKFNLKQRDILLIASDGLFTLVNDQEILEIILDKSLTLRKKAEALIEKAVENGGYDNISVVLINPFKRRKENNKEPEPFSIKGLLEILALTVLVLLFLLKFASANYFVTVKSGNLVLNQGYNKKVLGIPLSRQAVIEPIDEKEIPEWLQKRLEKGIPAADREDGEGTLDYVKSYTQ